jgi:DNA-binding transcriptional regulator YiaG
MERLVPSTVSVNGNRSINGNSDILAATMHDRSPTQFTHALVEARQMASSGVARMIREAAGLSLAEMGRAVAVDPATVWRWETGERTPTAEPAVRWRDFLVELRDRNRRKVPA